MIGVDVGRIDRAGPEADRQAASVGRCVDAAIEFVTDPDRA